MLENGKILSSEIKKNLDGDHATQLMQVEIDPKTKDVQTVEELHIPGYQYKPHPNAIGFFSKIHEAWKVLTGADDKVVKDVSLLPGESKLYSYDAAGVIIASIHFKTDGTIMVANPALGILFDLVQHFHLGNLGYNTGPPITGAGTPPPAAQPTIETNGTITDALGTNSTAHGHEQGIDSDNNVQVKTDNAS